MGGAFGKECHAGMAAAARVGMARGLHRIRLRHLSRRMMIKHSYYFIASVLALATVITTASPHQERADAVGAVQSMSEKTSWQKEVPETSAAALIGAVGLFLLLRRRR